MSIGVCVCACVCACVVETEGGVWGRGVYACIVFKLCVTAYTSGVMYCFFLFTTYQGLALIIIIIPQFSEVVISISAFTFV